VETDAFSQNDHNNQLNHHNGDVNIASNGDGSDDYAHYFPSHSDEEDVLMLFKYYDPWTEAVYFVGHSVFKKNDKVADFLPAFHQLSSSYSLNNNPWLTNQSLEQSDGRGRAAVEGDDEDATKLLTLFEEVKPNMVLPLKENLTLREAELGNGDIVIIQKKVASPRYVGAYRMRRLARHNKSLFCIVQGGT
jgi:hypothetical protein